MNGSAETEIASTIASGTLLGWAAEMTNTSNGIRSFNFSRLDCEHN